MRNPDNPNGNPRITRAFSHSARTEANADPTGENIARVLRWDEKTAKGPGKSQQMGRGAVVGTLADMVAVVDWTVVGEGGEGNYGGVIVPRDAAKKALSELAERRGRSEEDKDRAIPGLYNLLISSGNPRWVASSLGGLPMSGIAKTVEIGELVKSIPKHTVDMDGTRRPLPVEKTVLGAIKRVSDARNSARK